MDKKELDKKYDLYYDEYDEYILGILKKATARQLSKLYEYDLLVSNETLKQHIGSISDVFNISVKFDNIRKDVELILKNKYNLVIVKDEPLVIKKFQ